MKVIHVAETAKGGVATILRQLVAHQLAMLVDVTCLLPKDHLGEMAATPEDILFTFDRKGRSIFAIIRLALQILKLKDTNPDIVHFHSSFAGFVGRAVFVVSLRKSRPVIIYSPHAWSFIRHSSKLVAWFFRSTERFLSKYTDKIICVSDHEKEIAIANGIPPSKLITIYNATEPPLEFKCESTRSKKTRLLFVGRLDYQKGIDILMSAFEQLDPLQFELTVIGEPVLSTKPFTSDPRVRYLGWMDRVKLAEHFRSSDILVVPSRWEAFGLVVVESYSYGTPVIASRNTSLVELIKEGVTGYLFEDGNSNDLARILRDVDITSWRQMRDDSYRAYSDRYKSIFMCEGTLRLYEAVMLEKHGSIATNLGEAERANLAVFADLEAAIADVLLDSDKNSKRKTE